MTITIATAALFIGVVLGYKLGTMSRDKVWEAILVGLVKRGHLKRDVLNVSQAEMRKIMDAGFEKRHATQ